MQQTDTKYLLRFDDLCPTMNWKIWSEIEAVLLERRLKPVLAVVPDNQDPGLQVDRAADDPHSKPECMIGAFSPVRKTKWAGLRLQAGGGVFPR